MSFSFCFGFLYLCYISRCESLDSRSDAIKVLDVICIFRIIFLLFELRLVKFILLLYFDTSI